MSIGTAGAASGSPAPDQPGVKDRALEVAATAKESATKGLRSVKEYIVNEPARALGIALGLGVLLGWLIKRR